MCNFSAKSLLQSRRALLLNGLICDCDIHSCGDISVEIRILPQANSTFVNRILQIKGKHFAACIDGRQC